MASTRRDVARRSRSLEDVIMPVSRHDLEKMKALANDGSTNDRTVAIVCLAHLEDVLSDALRIAFVGLRPAMDGELFGGGGGNAPLGTFRNKVIVAEAIGLVAQEFAAELRAMATVRNRFAHRMDVESFDHDGVRDWCDRLVFLDRRNLLFSAALVLLPDPTRRERFVYSAVAAAISLHRMTKAGPTFLATTD